MPFSLEQFRAELDGLLGDAAVPHKYDSAALAAKLSERDPLGKLRDGYELPRMRDITGDASVPADAPAYYFCGNSLGPLAKRSRKYVQEELDVWGSVGVNGHFDHVHGRPWASIDERATRFTAEIVGAKRSEVAVMATLTQNLHTMLATFYRPRAGAARTKILYEKRAFPSDKYALDSLCRLNDLDPRACLVPLTPREGESYLRTEDILQAIADTGDAGAMIMLGGVQYFTGQLFELETICKAAHDAGMVMGVDLAHAFLNVPLALHDWGIDWAVWCSYKYGSGGPGGIAGLFLHEKWHTQDLVRPSGWWGHNRSTRFTMPEDFDPIPGAAGWQVSNPSVLDVSVLVGSLETVWEGVKAAAPNDAAELDKIGTDEDTKHRETLSSLGYGRIMPHMRAKSQRLTAYLELLMGKDGLDFEQYGVKLRLITPEDPEQRGSQLCVQFLENAAQRPGEAGASGAVARSMAEDTLMAQVVHLMEKKRGVICDMRYPDVLRVAPLAAFNTYAEVYYVAQAIAWALQQVGHTP